MNILLADSDRDFLQSYRKLLSMEGHTVVTAFDGAQAVSLLRSLKVDICVLEEHLPRIVNEEILQVLKDEGIPVIVLSDGGVTVKTLLDPVLPNDFLSFPFLPADLTRLIRDITDKTASGKTVTVKGVEVDVAGFCFPGSRTPLTNGEIDLLSSLENPVKAVGKRKRVMIRALNEKLKRTGNKAQILYETDKGYRLVSENG